MAWVVVVVVKRGVNDGIRSKCTGEREGQIVVRDGRHGGGLQEADNRRSVCV